MESNRSSKGFALAKTYQLVLFALALHVCVVGAANYVMVNDPAQRELCRVKTSKSVCLQDSKCGWNPWQGLCNEADYQADIQTCDNIARTSCTGQNCLL